MIECNETWKSEGVIRRFKTAQYVYIMMKDKMELTKVAGYKHNW